MLTQTSQTSNSGTTEPPRIVVADPTSLFAHRARRFATLADGHALGDWLRLLGRLSLAQHQALRNLPAVPLPDDDARRRAAAHAMPPLPAQHWPRDPAWRAALRTIIDLVGEDSPEATRRSLAELAAATDERIEAIADRVLQAELHGEQAGQLPFVAAALQVYWTGMASAIGDQGIAPIDVPGLCPCCGSLPVASVVRIAPAVNNLRYLHCSLCNTEWNLVRVHCAACGANDSVSYRQLEGAALIAAGAMRAETCDHCRSYLKILYQEQAPEGDPVADDLATLALDILVNEAGYSRAGPNLLFVAGG